MIVIDASALAKFVMKEEGWERVAEYLKAGTVSIDLAAKEVVNAIWRRLRRKEVTPQEASLMLGALKAVLGKAVKLEDESTYLDSAAEIAFARGITVYDALYVAAAKVKGLKLLTADEAQARAAEAEDVDVILLN